MSVSQTPHSLELAIDFVNTLDIDEGTDEITGPDELCSWLRERGLLDSGASPADDPDRARGPSLRDVDYRHAIALREALRALMLANNGQSGADEAWRELERVARRGELGVHFASDGTASLRPGAAGGAGALARLLVPVAGSLADGSWQRVKACRAPGCGWAFYDRSRNRSGVWCEMAVCGNRTKVRTYRERDRVSDAGRRTVAEGA